LVKTASGASPRCPKVASGAAIERSEEKVFEPPSMMIWPGRAVEITVTRMEAVVFRWLNR